ncbi:NAD(P)/FAD-dependent oxidoreductase [Microbacterium sp.]|uniref:NAD(P)/FAD-dependent oxidoreductase n=1 Tax=Microbacterium sp. TaxID=51671 RepID=UPI003C788C90
MVSRLASSAFSVVIVGGGYAGMIASNRLRASLTAAEQQRVRITIVNPSDRFVHRIRLHEHAAGASDAVLPLRSMIHDDVDVVVGRAVRIDTLGRAVEVVNGGARTTIGYDGLVYAVGSMPATAVPGVSEHAVAIGEVDGAEEVRRRLSAARTLRVCVVGGGPMGIETVTEIAEAHPRLDVTLLAGGRLGAGLRPAARRSIRRAMARLRIEIVEGIRVERVTSRGVRLRDGTERRFDLTVWAAGFDVPDLAAASGLAVDDRDRLLVDPSLVSISNAAVIGAGDAVRLPDSVGAHLPMGARVALPMGGAAADTILAHLRSEPAPSVSIGLLGPSLSLGRRRGYIQVTRRDDSPLPIAFTGLLGAAIKAWVCRMTIDVPRAERVRPGAYKVPPGPKARRG